MTKGGAIISLIMGIILVVLMIFSFFIGGVTVGVIEGSDAQESVFDSSALGFIFAVGLIVLGSVGMGSKSPIVGILVLSLSIWGCTIAVAMLEANNQITGMVMMVFLVIGGLGGLLHFSGSLIARKHRDGNGKGIQE
jgi:hypothetical protein